MNSLIILIIVFVFQFGINCFGQSEGHQIVKQDFVSDSLTQFKFNKYLSSILSLKSDTIIKIDSTLSYKVNFVAYHKFNFDQDFHKNFYADSLKTLCVSNPKRIQDSIIKLNFFDFNTLSIRHMKLRGNNPNVLKVFTFKKLNPNTGKSYNGFASFNNDADYSSLLSFNNGKCLIVFERKFFPDVKGGMPPGNDVTYFLEVIE